MSGLPEIAELKELAALSALEPTGMLDLFEDFRLLTEAGLPIVRAEIDPTSAVAADGFRFTYKLSDLLLVRLAALRARHINSGEVEGTGCGHSSTPANGPAIEPDEQLIELVVCELLRFTRDDNEDVVARRIIAAVFDHHHKALGQISARSP